MTAWARLFAAATAVALVLTAAGTASASRPMPTRSAVAELRVVFAVENVNRSQVPCASDGAAYDLTARIVGPSALLGQRRVDTATLYLHGLGLTSYYWHFPVEPSLSHAVQMAELGHVSVVYDRLGYGENPKPAGMASCYGSEADVAAQIVQRLKSGDYVTDSDRPPTFDRVVVASHSQAGLILQPMAYSFDAADALIVTSWTDDGNRPQVLTEVVNTAQECALSAVDPQARDFYGRFPRDDAAFRSLYFYAARDEVVDIATALRQADPCGLGGSLPQTLTADRSGLARIDEPVLLVYGEHDGYRDRAAAQAHAARFAGSDDVTLEIIAGAGNALTLEPSGVPLNALVASWLCERRLASAQACTAAAPAAAPAVGSVGPMSVPPPVVAAAAAQQLASTGASAAATAGLASLAGAALLCRRRRIGPRNN